MHGTDINSAINFNNYLTTGIYSIGSNSVAQNCSNKPCSNAGRFCVWSLNSATFNKNEYNYGGQIYYDIYNNWYSRNIDSGGGSINYGTWKTVTKT